jgi:hypothetical protein
MEMRINLSARATFLVWVIAVVLLLALALAGYSIYGHHDIASLASNHVSTAARR